MPAETATSSLPVRPAKQHKAHPLAPITEDEIKSAVLLTKSQWPAGTDFQFKSITLNEPAKAEMIPCLEAESQGHDLPHIDRRIFVTYYVRKTVSFMIVCPIRRSGQTDGLN